VGIGCALDDAASGASLSSREVVVYRKPEDARGRLSMDEIAVASVTGVAQVFDLHALKAFAPDKRVRTMLFNEMIFDMRRDAALRARWLSDLDAGHRLADGHRHGGVEQPRLVTSFPLPRRGRGPG
jgi:hypothetical protein